MKTVGPITNCRIIAILIAIIGSFVQESRGQAPPETQVQQQVETLFNGMKEGDSSKVRSVLAKNVQMFTSAVTAEGETKLIEGSAIRFLTAVGTPHEEVWDERISDLEIRVDGPLAAAWMKYSFYRGETFSHCGVNAMTFLWKDGAWKIIYLIDTRRKEGC